MNFYDDQSMTTRELFDKFFPGREDVIRLLMEPITYANGSTLEDPAISYGIVFSNFMSKGVFTFEGGTDRLIGLMEAELQQERRRYLHQVPTSTRIDCQRRPRARRRGQRPHDPHAGRGVERQSQATIFHLVGEEYFDRGVRRRGPGRAAQQFQHAGLHGAQAGRADRRIDGRPAVQLDRAAVSHRAAAEPRHHQPHVFVLLPADAARRPAAVPDRLQHERQLRRLGEALNDEEYEASKRDLDRNDARRARQVRAERPRADRPRRGLDAGDVPALHASTSTAPASARSSKAWPSAAALPQQIAGLYHAGSVGIIMSGWLGAMNYGVIVANEVDSQLMSMRPIAAPVASHQCRE